MDIRILLDYGQGYNVSLTPSDARHLWEQLNGLFKEPEKGPAYKSVFVPLGGKGYEVPSMGTENIKLAAEGKVLGMIEKAQYNAEAKAEESPKTLRDDHFYTDGTCKCMAGVSYGP